MSGPVTWATASWNPTVGCSPVSAGCKHCWAQGQAVRQIGSPAYAGIVERPGRWTGKARLLRERVLQPLQCRTPQRYAVSLMGDLFHESLPREAVTEVLDTAVQGAIEPGHTFIFVTKRPGRMADAVNWYQESGGVCGAGPFCCDVHREAHGGRGCPLPERLWVLASAEDQATVNDRLLQVLRTRATVRGLSLEPLLGPVDLHLLGTLPRDIAPHYSPVSALLGWVIVGCESGPQRRPMRLEWAESLATQCREAGVPFFLKQIPGPDGRVIHDPTSPAWPSWGVREFPTTP